LSHDIIADVIIFNHFSQSYNTTDVVMACWSGWTQPTVFFTIQATTFFLQNLPCHGLCSEAAYVNFSREQMSPNVTVWDPKMRF